MLKRDKFLGIRQNSEILEKFKENLTYYPESNITVIKNYGMRNGKYSIADFLEEKLMEFITENK